MPLQRALQLAPTRLGPFGPIGGFRLAMVSRFWPSSKPVSGEITIRQRQPVTAEAGQTDPQQAVARGQFRAFSCGPPKHADLVAQSQVLELDGGTRTEDREQSCEECRERNEHQRRIMRERYNSHRLRQFEVFKRHRTANREAEGSSENIYVVRATGRPGSRRRPRRETGSPP